MVKRKRRTKAEIEAASEKTAKKVKAVEAIAAPEATLTISIDDDILTSENIDEGLGGDFTFELVNDPEELAKIPSRPVIVPIDPEPIYEVDVCEWNTPNGGKACVLLGTFNKAKQHFQFTGSNEEFIKTIQKKIDNIACANPTWVMQKVFEELAG